MANRNKKQAYYRLGMPGGAKKVLAVRLEAQRQFSSKAVSSPVYAQVKSTLDAWTGSAEAVAKLVDEVNLAEKNLAGLRTQLHQAEGVFSLDERTYRTAAQLACAGKPELITSLGFLALTGRAQAATTPVGPPTDLVATDGVDPGSVHLKFVPPKGQHAYMVQMSSEPVSETSWRALPGTTHRTVKIGDLVPGQRVWLRVATVSAGAQSAFSRPVSITVR